jgi:hypothetical protein
MRKTIEECKSSSINSVSARYGITLATLYWHYKSGFCKKQLGRYRTIFTEEQETELLEYLKEMDCMFYVLTKSEFMGLAYDFAWKNEISHP